MFDDIRNAFRSLRRRPGFLLLGSSALGVGLAAAILVFGVVNTMLLRPLPGTHAAEPLVEIGRVDGDTSFDSVSFPDFVDLRESSETLSHVFAYQLSPAYFVPGESSTPVRSLAMVVSGDYFAALGARMALGQPLGVQHDAAPGREPVVVLSHAAFERYFDADEKIIGTVVRINGYQYKVIGVTEPAFRGHIAAIAPDVFVPLSMAQAMQVHEDEIREQRGSTWLQMGGKLAPGVTLEQAQAELDSIAAGLIEEYGLHEPGAMTFGVAPLRPLPQRGQQIITFLSIGLLVMCAAVLALACTNLAGVMLARGESRTSELALRSAIGAARGRLVMQLFLEAIIVAFVAGAIGLLLAFAARNILEAIPLPLPIPVDLGIVIDWRVAVFAMGTSLLVALSFGLLPALRTSQVSPVRAMGTHAAAIDFDGRPKNRSVLLTIQSALTVALLLVAAVTVFALDAAADIETGFRTENVYAASIDMDPLGLRGEAAADRVEQLTERLRNTPGVTAASFASVVPLTMEQLAYGVARLPGSEQTVSMSVNTVGEGFFDVFDMPVKGIPVNRTMRAADPYAAVINERLANRVFGTTDVTGREFEMGWGDDWDRIRVTGVVANGRYASLEDDDTAFAFLPATQWQRGTFTLFVHSTLGAEALRQAIEPELRTLMPDMPPLLVNRFADMAAFSVLPQKILGSAASALGVLALLLAATGLYGVLAYQVERRYREFGVRRALGASSMQVSRALLKRAIIWLAVGVAIGILLAQLAVIMLGEMLFGIGLHPLAVGGVLLAFGTMTALAIAGPLWRVLQLQPMAALRYE